jgi:hypothetical protein
LATAKVATATLSAATTKVATTAATKAAPATTTKAAPAATTAAAPAAASRYQPLNLLKIVWTDDGCKLGIEIGGIVSVYPRCLVGLL